ncbi:Adaptive-response sensory-kinase SasA [Hyella patelloides LEGE 07179]|uniref:Adaptive-response sensory-kinase SasA n=1 Tax=Hyella patelloides LEGE 07179 TaxID=945734 RepID=A0A563VZ81_9CYAN|nr:histidine kinase [Hyella patelloides]VEP16730.1 Adaptive-response sensory-kinase SasA [Hyella patelloides LEGE 07179]
MSFLKLLLFVDDRPAHRENIRSIRGYLESLQAENYFELDIIETRKQPHLVEHFKLVATPALVKIAPSPKQTLAGSNLVAQLEEWWPRWKNSLKEAQENSASQLKNSDTVVSKKSSSSNQSVFYDEKSLRLSDEIFRLQQEKEELKEQLNFKDQILAMLAHDLRSPLTAASLAMETLELSESYEASEQKRKLRKQLFKQSRKQFGIMKRMITELLETSRSVSAKLEVRPHKLNLRDLCLEIISQFRKQTTVKFQTIVQDIPQDTPTVYADEELLRQLLVNLLDNALKYTPEGGEISLSILHRTSQKVQVSVSDTGPGIPPEKQERIFEGHFRLQRDEAQEGYGLGLALCRRIVHAHYGQIWVDSSPNSGSSFHFTLPVYR